MATITMLPLRRLGRLCGLGAAFALLPCAAALANCTLVAGNLATAPDARFANLGDGTAIDTATDLMWTTGAPLPAMAWTATAAAATAATTGGHNDWRVPTRQELGTLVESGCAGPASNTSVFAAGTTTVLWSSTAGSTGTAWFVDVTFGADGAEATATPKALRLVRAANDLIFRDGFQ